MVRDAVQETLENARQALLRRLDSRGAFRGDLSSSAVSTATAAIAFALAHRARPDSRDARLAARARDWLAGTIVPEADSEPALPGGFGDTSGSPPNISTTTLSWIALSFGDDPASALAARRAEAWIHRACSGADPDSLARTIRARYGKDHTFSVPILLTCALGGKLGPDGWRHVPPLPFELAACPPSWLRILRMRTVSYALPALISVGQARHHHRPSKNPLARILRSLVRRRTLRILEDIQPRGGGYLEAAPLTSFVCMSLISMDLGSHPVVRQGLDFLRSTVREDGSWPIDTNLDTWTTTLAINALRGSPSWATRSWLLGQQHRRRHPYTGAGPGGFAWTDLPGGVPDADDTSAALLALRHLDPSATEEAAGAATWLLDLANRDGGIPTFCRGWGRLPFDRSCPDISAHAVRAWAAWRVDFPAAVRRRIDRATTAAIHYLARSQRADGSWVPLWFGSQHAPGEENPLYGTTRVLMAAGAVPHAAWSDAPARALGFVLSAQAGDGGFGAAPGIDPTVEETALAVESLASPSFAGSPGVLLAVSRGVAWLIDRTARGTSFAAAPIGLYFAKLWYSEALYPLIFTVAAIEAAQHSLKRDPYSCLGTT